MKYTVLLITGLLFQIPGGITLTENDLDQTDLQCIKEMNISKDLVIQSFDENDFIRTGNKQMNDFYACAWKKDKLQSKDGSINTENLQKMIENLLEIRLGVKDEVQQSTLAKKGITNCKNVKGSDDGDTCVQLYNCLLKHIKSSLET